MQPEQLGMDQHNKIVEHAGLYATRSYYSLSESHRMDIQHSFYEILTF